MSATMTTSSTDDLSFLPDDYVAARRRARANRLCGSLLAVTVLGVAGAFQYAERSLNQLRAEHAAVTEQFDRESARLRELNALQAQQDAVARRAAMAEALVEKVPRAALLDELRNLLPANTSLAEVVMTSRVRPIVETPEQQLAKKRAPSNGGPPKPPEPQPKRYDVGLRVAGLAYTDVQVAQFISRLSRSRYFEDVNLLVSKEHAFDGQVVRRFEVDTTVRAEPLPAAPGDASLDPVVSTTEASLAP